MLKIWKQAWKKEDSSRRAQSEQGNDGPPDAQLSGASGGGPHLDSAIAAPPSTGETVQGPVLPHDQTVKTGTRRGRESSPVVSLDRPSKKLKADNTGIPQDQDSLGNHLPEVIGTDDAARLDVLSVSNLEVHILEHAKRENTIAILASSHAANKIVIDFLTWAVELERRRPIHTVSKPRPTALLVVDDDRLVDAHAADINAESNLTVGKYTEDVRKSGSRQWLDFLPSDVVIISANILLDCLLQGSLSMSHLHTLLVNDAQNIKDQDSHPIVRIMNEFCRAPKARFRLPRIMVIATTPSDRKFHFDSSVLKLETLFDAKVFGISDEKRTEILALPDRPTDLVVLYNPPLRTVETHLFRQLHQLDPSETIFRHHFRSARRALVEVGSCGSDLIWRRALREIEASVPPDYDEDDDFQSRTDVATNRARVSIRDIVKNWVFTMPNLDLTSRGFNVTPKYLKLVDVLAECEEYGDGFRGIVFVQRRAIAYVIADLLRTLDDRDSFLRPCALVGHGPSTDQLHKEEILRCFANGTYNLLVATKFAEDLELPKACVVIRFDLFESQVSHAYVRARTRGRESHLIHMVERGNDVHRRIVSQITQGDQKMQRWTESVFKTIASSAPPRTLRETTDPYHSDSEDEDETFPFIKDPTTSGRIYLQDAMTVVYRFVSTLQSVDGELSDASLFEFEDYIGIPGSAREVICTVILPKGLPIDRVSGPPCESIAQARRTACFRACSELFDLGLLDYRFFPSSRKIAIAETSSTGSVNKDGAIPLPSQSAAAEPKSAGTRSYPRKKPDFWANAGSVTHRALYPTIISTDSSMDEHSSHAPMLILTWRPLPRLASFKLFFSGVPAFVHFQQGAAFEVDEPRLHDIYMYTIRLCRAVANKPFVCSLDTMPYFFAPLGPTWLDDPSTRAQQWEFPNVFDHIPWESVALCAKNWVVALRSENLQTLTEDIDNAVIQDRWVEFTRRYDAVQVRPDLTPLSKPVDSPREANYENLVEYCKARRKGFEGLQDYKQPLIEVSKVPAVLNRLNPTSRPVTVSTRSPAKYLIPELCAKFTIPANIFRTALLLPSITRRIDDFLIVKELNANFFDHAILEHYLHTAISAPSAGIEFDYERLELLGDAFLKYLSSIYVFVTNPAQHEGALHIARQRIISNKSLLQNASRAGLPGFIQAKPFTFKLWQPPNFSVLPPINHCVEVKVEEGIDEAMVQDLSAVAPEADGSEPMETDVGKPLEAVASMAITVDTSKPSDADTIQPTPDGSGAKDGLCKDLVSSQDNTTRAPETTKLKKRSKKKRQQDELDTQWLGDKAVADVAEAIIGAAYISGGRETALKVTKALNIPIPNIDRWSDFGRKVLAPPPGVTAKLRPGSIEAVESIIGHKFNRPHLLAQALTHASIQGYETTSYERLEFIGDAILDFMVIRHIYDRDTQLSPGALTLLKGAMVSNSALAAVCVWSGLQEHLLFESYSLASNIQTYADQLKAKQIEEHDLAAKEGRAPGQYWLEIEPPKALSDVVESIIGAIYISDNFSPVGAESLFDNILKPFYDRHITLKTLSHHPTKILFELFQAQGCQQFEIVKEKEEDQQFTRCDVIVHDVVLASATDTTAPFAARRASLSALDALEGDAEFLTRTCDCRTHAQVRKAQKKAIEKILSGLREDDDDLVAAEGDGSNTSPPGGSPTLE